MNRIMTTTALILSFAGAAAHAAEHSGGGAFADYQMDPASEMFASDLIGSSIFGAKEQEEGESSGTEGDSEDPTANRSNLGDINDLIITQDGQVDAAILGIGGFLGLGERDVAVKMSEIQIMRDGEDPQSFTLVIEATQEEIENAPEFVRPGEEASAEGEGEGEGESAEGEGESADGEAENAAENAGEEAAAETEEAANEAENAADEAAAEAEETANEAENAAENAAAEAENAADNAAAEVEETASEAENAAENAAAEAENAAEDAEAAAEGEASDSQN